MKNHDFAVTITGASGFVGSVLARGLLESDYDVRVFGADLEPSHRIEALAEHDDFTFVEYDVHQPLHSDLLAVDALYHFAGIANPAVYVEDPRRVMDLNIMGLRNILDRIVRWGSHRPRIIYSSTSETYGKNTAVPFVENESDMVFGQTDKSRWCYALTKATCEHYLKAFESDGIRHTTFRLFNFVGREVDAPGAGRVITQMAGKAIREGKIGVALPGTQTRCFTWEDDFVVPLMRACTYKREKAGYADGCYTVNLGSQGEFSMLELAYKIATIVEERGYHPGIESIEIEHYDPVKLYGEGYEDMMRRVPDVTRARRIFDWEATTHIDDYLPIIVDAINARMGAKS